MSRHTFTALHTTFVIDSEFEFVKELGQSANGSTVVAKHRRSGEECAIKKITSISSRRILAKRCLREIKLLNHFRGHNNIICVHDMDIIFRPDGGFDEVYTYEGLMEADLNAIIRSGQPLTDAHFQSFMYQSLCGLKYIHSANVLHRDLKPSNLLVNENCELKICDFGSARGHTPGAGSSKVAGNPGHMTEYVVTRWYRAPEIMLSFANYSTSIDIWSVGCILAELLGGKPIFKGRDYVDQLHQILHYLGTPSEELLRRVGSPKAQDHIRSLPIKPRIPFSDLFPKATPLAIDFLTQMLCFDPAARISCEQALIHPYLEVWHDPADEPICNSKFDFSFEEEDTIKGMQKLIAEEVDAFRIKVRAQANVSSQKRTQDSPSIPPSESVNPPVQESCPSIPKTENLENASVTARSPSPHPHSGNCSDNAIAVPSSPQPTAVDGIDQSLDTLRGFVSFDTLPDSSMRVQGGSYISGFRPIVKRVLDWIDNSSLSERILWIHGRAGIGKSTVAREICHLDSQDKVAAAFFFSRSNLRNNGGHRLFPTIAWQIMSYIPDFRGYLAKSLNEDPSLLGKAIEIQFEQLIFRPLLNMSRDVSPLLSTRVIVIDGLDECLDQAIQRKILQIAGIAVSESNFPLRFIFLARPEAHIEDTFNQLHDKTARIDVDVLVDSYRVIEEYLEVEFARIAAERELVQTSWPGRQIIENLTSRSVGELVYASTLTKFVGDVHFNAVEQLEIIMGIDSQPGSGALYLEILKRQPDQSFVKDFLTILVARKNISQFPNSLGKDDALLLNMDEGQLISKLRGMHSLLQIQRGSLIDVHHPSFLDFLQEPSRSTEYHVSKQNGTRRYLERVVAVLLIRVSSCIEQPDSHEADHFSPEFGNMIHHNPGAIELPPQVWEEVLHPLVCVQSELLEMHNFESLKRGYCDRCRFFQITDDLLLHLKSLQATAGVAIGSSHQVNSRLNFGLGFGLAGVAAAIAFHLASHR